MLRHMMRMLAAMVCLLVATAADAQTVYKCTDKSGTPVFTTSPCGPAAQKIDVQPASGPDRVQQPGGASASSPSASMTGDDARLDAACRNAAAERSATASSASPIDATIARLEQQQASLENEQRKHAHSEPGYAYGAGQLANANNQLESARNTAQIDAQNRSATYSSDLARCDSEQASRARNRAAVDAANRARGSADALEQRTRSN